MRKSTTSKCGQNEKTTVIFFFFRISYNLFNISLSVMDDSHYKNRYNVYACDEIHMHRRKQRIVNVVPELIGRNVLLDGSRAFDVLGNLGVGTVVSFSRLVCLMCLYIVITCFTSSPYYQVALRSGKQMLVNTFDVRRYLLEEVHPELIGRRVRFTHFYDKWLFYMQDNPEVQRRVSRGTVQSYDEQ